MCGFIGVTGAPSAVREIYDGLVAVQHRGQDAAGIVTYDGRFHVKKGEGLVRDIFSAANFRRLKGGSERCLRLYRQRESLKFEVTTLPPQYLHPSMRYLNTYRLAYLNF